MDIADTLASDAAQEIVKALVAGLVEVVKKVPRLWRRAGEHEENLIEGEIERSSLALQKAGSDLPSAQARQEGVWEGLLRALLARDPGAAAEVQDLLEESKHRLSQMPTATQNVTAAAPHSTAQGVMFGKIVNHSELHPADIPPEFPAPGTSTDIR